MPRRRHLCRRHNSHRQQPPAPVSPATPPATEAPPATTNVPPTPPVASEEASLDESLTVESVTAKKDEALASVTNDEELSKRLGTTYDAALDQISRRDKHLTRAKEFENDVAGLESTVASLKQALDQAEKATPQAVLTGTVAELELERTRLDQRLAELKKQLTTLEAQTATRPNRRNELRQKLAKLEQDATDLQTESAAPAATGESPLVSRARAIERLARKQAIAAEVPSRRAELAKLDSFDAAGVPSLQRDLLTRQVALATEELKQTVEALEKARTAAARATVSQARREEDTAQPGLRYLAEENRSYAEANQRLAEQISRSENEKKRVGSQLEEIQQQYRQSRNKVDTVGLSTSVGKLLRKQRLLLPNTSKLQESVRARQPQIDEAQLALFDYNDERALIADPERRARQIVDNLDPSTIAGVTGTILSARRPNCLLGVGISWTLSCVLKTRISIPWPKSRSSNSN